MGGSLLTPDLDNLLGSHVVWETAHASGQLGRVPQLLSWQALKPSKSSHCKEKLNMYQFSFSVMSDSL